MACKDKQSIVRLFEKNVKGLKATPQGNLNHDGRCGHWLEEKMGLRVNGLNQPDILGYEMKNDTSSKTTFGDWSPDRAIFKQGGLNNIQMKRAHFLRVFGAPNPLKDDRYSWSGSVFPKYEKYTAVGTTMLEDHLGNIIIQYDFSEDTRENKKDIVPEGLQKDGLELAVWDKDKIKSKLERKFNQKGWFICKRNNEGFYEKICFGAPICFSSWIKLVRSGEVYLDSGMYDGNNRPYQNWRASNALWESLIEECFS